MREIEMIGTTIAFHIADVVFICMILVVGWILLVFIVALLGELFSNIKFSIDSKIRDREFEREQKIKRNMEEVGI